MLTMSSSISSTSRITRAACLSCRAAKIKCNGEHPCHRCSSKGLICSFTTSRRGGIRRHPKRPADNSTASLASIQSTHFGPSSHSGQGLPIAEQGMWSEKQLPEKRDLGRIINLLGPLDTSSDRTAPRKFHGYLESTNSPCLRIFKSDEDILSAYYVYIHRFLPILPSHQGTKCSDIPIAFEFQGEIEDLSRSSLPHWPGSSLTLAISAIVSLIPLSQDPYALSDSGIRLRRLHAKLYAEAALAEVENEIDVLSAPTTPRHSSALGETAEVDQTAKGYPVLALILLSVYEYCQRGNISRMRIRANQAVTTAVDLSLHNLGPSSTEAERRTWWSAMLVLYLSSIDQQISPIICLGDQRILTPFPSLNNFPSQPWALLLEAEKSILSVSETFNECFMNSPTDTISINPSSKIMQLETHIASIIQKLDRLPKPTSDADPDENAAQCIWRIAVVLVHSARIRLHRARAFMDIPIFLDKYCDLSAIKDMMESSSAFDSKRPSNFDSVFPFTEQDSSLLCLKSSQVIARNLENLPAANPYLDRFAILGGKSSAAEEHTPFMLPFFMCAAMQSSYVLLMFHYRLRAAFESGHLSMYSYLLHSPQVASEPQDAERLLRELRQGMESIIGAVQLAQMFEGVSNMSQEIIIAYQSTLTGE